MSRRLSKEDWINAGLEALANSGYEALRAEALARTLRATKGSFYWHFRDLSDYKTEMLQKWQTSRVDNIIGTVSELAPGIDRLNALLKLVGEMNPYSIEIQAERAIREWARIDKLAARTVEKVDERRVAFLSKEFRAAGISDEIFASAFYTSYLGTLTRIGDTSVSSEAELRLVLNCLISGFSR